jgi:hypothetical protein
MSTRAFYVLRLKAFLTPKDLGDLAGYTKAQMCNLARAKEIPGTRVNPGGNHYRFADTPEIRAWCVWKKRERERPHIRRSTAGKTTRERNEKIDRLTQILMERKPVGKEDKELALAYFRALERLALQRMPPLGDFPLLEGVRALEQGMHLFSSLRLALSDQPPGVRLIRRAMEALPIRPEARPHSAVASAKSQTKPWLRARR